MLTFINLCVSFVIMAGIHYRWFHQGYTALHEQEQLHKIQIIKQMLLHDDLLHPHTKLLDVGCGTGFYLPLFSCHVCGIDPCREMLQHCPVPHVQGRAEALPFSDGAFDVIISVTAAHHFTDPFTAFTEMERVARSGILISLLRTTPQYDFLVNHLTTLFHIKEQVAEAHDVIFNLRRVEETKNNV